MTYRATHAGPLSLVKGFACSHDGLVHIIRICLGAVCHDLLCSGVHHFKGLTIGAFHILAVDVELQGCLNFELLTDCRDEAEGHPHRLWHQHEVQATRETRRTRGLKFLSPGWSFRVSGTPLKAIALRLQGHLS